MDLYVDRFIARNQDFSSLMNQKFVKDMDVRDNILITTNEINFGFNDSYNIPFTESILFELFDMTKFRVKKFFTIPLLLNIEMIKKLGTTWNDNSNQKLEYRFISSSLISPRYFLLKYFFYQLYDILTISDNVLTDEEKLQYEEKSTSTEIIQRINEDAEMEIEDDQIKGAENAKRIEEVGNAKRIDDEIYIKMNDLIINNLVINKDLNNTAIEDCSIKENIIEKDKENHDKETKTINNSDKNNIDEEFKKYNDEYENAGYYRKMQLYISDYVTFNKKTSILSKLNKYININDLIYKNKNHNITPFYTKKEAIIYLTRLLLNNNENINLYEDETLCAEINKILKITYNKNYLDNDKVYTYLNTYIENTTFDEKTPVYFSDILYKKHRSVDRRIGGNNQLYHESIEENENENKGENENEILFRQKHIIELLLDEIMKEREIIKENKTVKEDKAKNVEYSFTISYKKMIENRKQIILNFFKNSPNNEQERQQKNQLATQLYKFKQKMPEFATKISHYSCTSPTNFLSFGIPALVFLPITGPIQIGYMAVNCILSAVPFLTIIYIFAK